MSDKALSSLLTAILLAALAVWVPLLEAFAWLRRRRPATVQAEREPWGRKTERSPSTERMSA